MSAHEHHRSAEWMATLRRVRPRFVVMLGNGPIPCAQTMVPGGRCQLGGAIYGHQPWDLGHLLGWAEGGTDDDDNLWPAHRKCNRSDGGRAGATRTNRARARRERGAFPSW